MTDRRPSGFRLWRQPPPTKHFAPEAEAYHHRQNLYFRLKVWSMIVLFFGVVGFVLFRVTWELAYLFGWRS